jgi:hypothetical protein
MAFRALHFAGVVQALPESRPLIPEIRAVVFLLPYHAIYPIIGRRGVAAPYSRGPFFCSCGA